MEQVVPAGTPGWWSGTVYNHTGSGYKKWPKYLVCVPRLSRDHLQITATNTKGCQSRCHGTPGFNNIITSNNLWQSGENEKWNHPAQSHSSMDASLIEVLEKARQHDKLVDVWSSLLRKAKTKPQLLNRWWWWWYLVYITTLVKTPLKTKVR